MMSSMFVVFEGIDGSGKTTVSNRVAKLLRKRGVEIEHIREGGEFASPLVTRMREFGKDTRNMSMRPLTEFLMYVARDAQLLSEKVKPALAKEGTLVFADRYLYSYEVLGHHGRGLEGQQVRGIIDSVAEGIWPDLVVLMDVDPHLARARRRSSKLEKRWSGKIRGKGGSRKGLGGVGMMHRLRAGYRTIAERESQRWLVVDNSNTDLDEVVEKIADAIGDLYRAKSSSRVIADTQLESLPPISAKQASFEAAGDAFFAMIARRADKEPAVAAYFLAGLVGERAQRWRGKLLASAPHLVAHGLRGLSDENSWELREKLKGLSPHYIAKSLSGAAGEDTRAQSLREELVENSPYSVLDSLGGRDDVFTWGLRKSLKEGDWGRCLASLRRMPSERAWQWREEYIAHFGMERIQQDILVARPLLSAIRGLGDERAWELRKTLEEESPAQVLKSLAGLDCPRSWHLRNCYAELAPKIVLRSFDSQQGEEAWAMRRKFAPMAKEALDSMKGLDCDAAWSIRESVAAIWPSTTVSSLGNLALESRGRELCLKLLAEYPQNLSLLKHATQILSGGATGGSARRKLALEQAPHAS